MFRAMKSGNERRERARREWRRAHGIRTLTRGTVLHLHGLPVRLRYSVDVVTLPENWKAIDALIAVEEAKEAPTWIRTRVLFGSVGLFGLVLAWIARGEPLLTFYSVVCGLGGACGAAFASYWAMPDNRTRTR